MFGNRLTETLIGGQAHLEVRIGGPQGGGGFAERNDATVLDSAVIDDAPAVPDPGRLARKRARDLVRTVHLAGVDRHTESGLGRALDGRAVQFGREAGLDAGHVDPDDAATGGDRSLDNLHRDVERLVAHHHGDDASVDPDGSVGLVETGADGRDHLGGSHPGGGVQQRSKPEFGVDHTVGRKVFDPFERDPAKCVGGLQAGVDQIEPGERIDEFHPRRDGHPLPERCGIVGRCGDTDRVTEVEHGRGPDPTVEMVVQDDERPMGHKRPALSSIFSRPG